MAGVALSALWLKVAGGSWFQPKQQHERGAKLKQARFYLLTLAGTAAVSRASSSCKN